MYFLREHILKNTPASRFYLITFLLLILQGCAATFTYKPLNDAPRNLEIMNITSYRDNDFIRIQGQIGNNLGFGINDIAISATAFNSQNLPIARTSVDLLGTLEDEHARVFELVFSDPGRQVRTFQILGDTYIQGSEMAGTNSAGFTKTVGFGRSAMQTANTIADATSGFSSVWSATGQAMNLANQASALNPPASGSSNSYPPQLVQVRSPLYAVSD